MTQAVLQTKYGAGKDGMVVLLGELSRMEVRQGSSTRYPYAALIKNDAGR